jgi:hypothetical protein
LKRIHINIFAVVLCVTKIEELSQRSTEASQSYTEIKNIIVR